MKRRHSSKKRITRKRIQKRYRKTLRRRVVPSKRFKMSSAANAGPLRPLLRKSRKLSGGGTNDMCGICPICESSNTERYATAPAGDKVFCRCSEGHIYSLTNDQSGNI